MQYRKLTELKKLEKNPRTITKEDFEKLKKSITKFWILEARPLILSNRTWEFVIIGWNMRYLACKELWIKEVPTHLIEWLSETDEDELIIRDNVSNWIFDYNILANEWNVENLKDWWVNVDFLWEDIIDEDKVENKKDKKDNLIECPKCWTKFDL